uniref:Putative nucleic-acid-binding protein from transposon x-element n=1 Tax=Lutzomyia longipalpis TaxID=7200 RepID=A0A1B0GHS3_LUTLO
MPAGKNSPGCSGWQQANKGSKRPSEIPSSSNTTMKQPKVTYWLAAKPAEPAETQNRFDPISPTNEPMDTNTASEETQEVTKETKEPKPSPIFLYNLEDIAPLRDYLSKVAGEEKFSLKCLINGAIKVQVLTAEAYNAVIKYSSEKRLELHTYQFKSERAFRVVLKGLHSSTKAEDIKTELERLGHKVQSIINVRQRTTKVPLSMFNVNLERKDSNKEIYKINRMLHCVVEFQPPRAKRELPQCCRCQQFGHTKAYCSRKPRCVKCSGEHLTAECPRKERDPQVKCANCGGAHPANYRGCEIHKQLQRRYFPKLREKTLARTGNSDNGNQNVNNGMTITPGLSFSGVVRGNTQTTANPSNNPSPVQYSNDMSELKEMMKGLMQQMSAMMTLLTQVLLQKK